MRSARCKTIVTPLLAGVRFGEQELMQGAVSFDNIELIKKLGAGCSSTVHLARDKVTGQLYALKCIRLVQFSFGRAGCSLKVHNNNHPL